MASSSICMIPLEERQHNFHFKSCPLSLRQLLPPIHITCRSFITTSWKLAQQAYSHLASLGKIGRIFRVAGCSRTVELLNRSCCIKCYICPNFDFIFEQEVGRRPFFDAQLLKCGLRRKGATECQSTSYCSYMYMRKYQLPRDMPSVLSNKHVIPKLPDTFVLIEIHFFLSTT